MTELLVIIVTGFVVIAAATVFGPRLGIAAPLVLVAIGVAASFLPVFAALEIDPEWILQGLLPPLLYSAAVSMPAMNFRREFGAISGLSVLLVLGSSLILGVFFMLVIPNLGFAWGVALGAIISPTDAVATSIVKGSPVSRRVVAMLDGESLLNDATAIALLRVAIVAAAGAFSFWQALGTFAYSVVVALIIGLVVGNVNLLIRRRIRDPAVSTVISFAVPFVAAVPAGLVGASGLVAAVVAGLVTGYGAARVLSPQNRMSDAQNWRTVELILEGVVFLTMGLQIKSVVEGVQDAGAGFGTTLLIAVGALVLTILVRAAYVGPLLALLSLQSRRSARMQPRVQKMQEEMQTEEGKKQAFERMNARRRSSERQLESFAKRVTQAVADIEYFLREPLGWREGTAVVWAGMRGAITVAAAQTLPIGVTPGRSALILIAFAVALLSLVVQGGTIGWVMRALAPKADEAAAKEKTRAQTTRIFELLKTSAETIPEPPDLQSARDAETFLVAKQYRLAVLRAQRTALLDARDNGLFDADVLETALANLDASEIDIELRGKLVS